MLKSLQISLIDFYGNHGFNMSDFNLEKEGQEYQACSFSLNDILLHSRLSKITPKKNGQFVTFWRRNKNGITEPFNEQDNFDYLVINIKFNDTIGQFVFPKSILIKKGVISTLKKEGKRGFRVYPIWDTPQSKQAKKTQDWQLNFFILIDQNTNLDNFKLLYLNS
jgi:hypothetical protein